MTRTVTPLAFAALEGWAEDDHAEALRVFLSTCGGIKAQGAKNLCAVGLDHQRQRAARRFFEAFFRPVLIEDGNPTLFTGYYEPELCGARERDERFRFPLYALPPEMRQGKPWLKRAQIEDGALDGRELEIAWLDDPVEAFFLQVQGSGRIRLPDGALMRVGYAGANGHPYSSVGKALVARGAVAAEAVSMDRIKDWVVRNPDEGRALLRTNASFVFFRELTEVPPDQGPLGAMKRSVTAMRSLAVDPLHVPLGAPVWIETDGTDPLRRLMVAQDTGSAIKGAQRADIFFGTGEAAGRRAGSLREGGRMVVLLPTHCTQAEAAGPADPS